MKRFDADNRAWEYIRKLEGVLKETTEWLKFVSENFDDSYHAKHVRIGAKSLLRSIEKINEKT